jgi:trigger factor
LEAPPWKASLSSRNLTRLEDYGQLKSSGSAYRVLTAKNRTLPAFSKPSLEGLVVRLPLLPPLTEDDITNAFVALAQDQGKRHPKPEGAEVDEGDEVVVDLVAYSSGKLVPFSPQEDLTALLTEDALTDPIAAALVGEHVGDRGMIDTFLPEDHSSVPYRGKPAVFAVQVKSSAAVDTPDAEDPVFLRELGYGNTLDDSLVAFTAELERIRASTLRTNGLIAVLDELARRTPFKIPKITVEKQLLNDWSAKEGRFLQRWGVPPADYDAAFEGWINDPETFSNTERSLRNAFLLGAVADAYKLKVDRATLESFALQIASDAGVSKPNALRESWAREPAYRTKMLFDSAMLYISEFVLSKAKIEYI